MDSRESLVRAEFFTFMLSLNVQTSDCGEGGSATPEVC
jgi:hypothetical protein